jgi:hypothetical protein
VSKDRAAPFSRKHRKYWIPVTGGMLLIGALNIGLGFCSYKQSQDVEPIKLVIPGRDAGPAEAIDAANTIGPAALPGDVVRAFTARYPQTIPSGVIKDADHFVIMFAPGAAHRSATFAADGTFLSEQ